MELIQNSIGPLTPVQQNILRSQRLRVYADVVKDKIDGVFNARLMDIYHEMLPISIGSIEGDQLSRFLLRLRQSNGGYQPKKYVGVTVVQENDGLRITLSLKSVWKLLLSQREIPEAAWEMSIIIPEREKDSFRKIIREFRPLLDDTGNFIRECWGCLNETGQDNLDRYYEIGKIKFTNFDIEL